VRSTSRLSAIALGQGEFTAILSEDCTRTTDGGWICVGEEIVVIGERVDPKIPDIPDRGNGGKEDADGDRGAGGVDVGAAEATAADAKAAEVFDTRMGEILQELLAREQRCRTHRQALDAAMNNYTRATAKFVTADKELDLAAKEALLAQFKIHADYLKNALQVQKQIIDGLVHYVAGVLREERFELAREKHDEAFAAVEAAQPPLDAASDAYQTCLDSPPPPPPDPEKPNSEEIDPGVETDHVAVAHLALDLGPGPRALLKDTLKAGQEVGGGLGSVSQRPRGERRTPRRLPHRERTATPPPTASAASSSVPT
jgi:hypothetical protein